MDIVCTIASQPVSSLDRKLLFKYLRSAFENDKLFAEDLKKLKAAIKEVACTVSELKRDLVLAQSRPRTQ